jgi:hypothetical protein
VSIGAERRELYSKTKKSYHLMSLWNKMGAAPNGRRIALDIAVFALSQVALYYGVKVM